MRARWLPVLIVVAAGAIAPAAALADGDPASDILPSIDYYLPYSPKVAPKQADQLVGLLREAKRKGVAFKVAVIATPTDLGALPELFGHPQAYAKFLDGEIKTFVDGERGTLLIVMPDGVGLAGRLDTPVARRAVAGLSFGRHASSTALAAGAADAIRAVARTRGRTLTATAASGGTSTGTIALVVAIIAALGLGGVLLVLQRR